MAGDDKEKYDHSCPPRRGQVSKSIIQSILILELCSVDVGQVETGSSYLIKLYVTNIKYAIKGRKKGIKSS